MVLLSNLFSPTSRSLSFSPSGNMLAVCDAKHARPDDTMSPNKTKFHQKLIFFVYIVPLLLSLSCGSPVANIVTQMLHPTKDSWNTTSVKMMIKSHPDASLPEIHSQCGYLSGVVEARATNVGLWVFPNRLVSLARCCC